ncbi:MAG: RluA family pseudouridine synthase [Clostridia bacterium]|nr:RluA family pseudouridine synthase [Clostridia bacterium]
MQILKINKNDAGQRLDKFLMKTLPNLPASMLYKSIRTKKIKLNRKRCEIGTVLSEGDEIQLFLKDELLEKKKTDDAFRKLTPRLSIVYEDENLLLVNKRAGLLVHADDGEDQNTLISHIKAYLYGKREYDPDREQSFAPALCNRIDRNTAGIVIAAKNAEALRLVNEVIKNRTVDKRYLAACHGIFEKKEDTLSGFLVKNSDQNLVKIYTHKPKNLPPHEVKEIHTRYRVLAEKDHNSLCEVELLTGRTHQIRAHLASIGHPLIGDGKYGVNKEDRAKGYKFQALASYQIAFTFPEDSLLSYLNQKIFALDPASVWFVGELFGPDAMT